MEAKQTPGIVFLRKREAGLSSGVEAEVSMKHWPYAICAPAPPWAFGKVVALCADKETATTIVLAWICHEELVHACEKALDRLEDIGSPYTRLLKAVLAKVKEG